MLLKAGTYRFNDIIDNIGNLQSSRTYNINFISNGDDYQGIIPLTSKSGMTGIFVAYQVPRTYAEIVAFSTVTGNGLTQGWAEGLQVISITEDTEVDDTFGTWYIANTNYNEVNTPTFSTIISKLQSLIDSANAKTGNRDLDLSSAFTSLENGFATLTTKEVTANGTYNAIDDGADGYSSVVVDVPSIIEVDELPTENIDINAVYLYDGALYRYIDGSWLKYVSTPAFVLADGLNLLTSDEKTFIINNTEE